MTSELLQLARECPGLTIQISLSDLMTANTQLVAEAKAALEQQLSDAAAEVYLSRTAAMKMLDVSETTLWRWSQNGYLKPLNVGGQRRYRRSDIVKIMEGGEE